MDLADYVGQVCDCLTKAPLFESGVRLTVVADEIWLDADRCWRVGLIVAELVRNAAGDGFSDGPGAIWIEITDTSGRINCLVCDDGCGLPTTRTARSRRLVEALATELGGSVDWVFAPGGGCVRVDIPAPDTGATDRRSRAPKST
jgi:two-component sensor histidine kinase